MGGSKRCQEPGGSLAVCVMCRAELSVSSSGCVLVRQRSVSLVGSPALPFIDQGGAGVTDERKRKKPKVEKVLQGSRVFLFPCACPANMVDCVRDGVFTDPYRAMPWPLSASGCVPSYAGGWCGVSEGQATTLRGVDGEVTLRPSL